MRHPEQRQFSWFSTAKSNGFRYDHALSSAPLDASIAQVEYDHVARESGASDHSVLVVDITLQEDNTV